jgi:hypothetical protein
VFLFGVYEQVSYAAQPTGRKLNQDSRNSVCAENEGDLLLRRSVLQAIFISYRRDDSEGEAGRLSDDLAQTFQEESVFMDVNAIQPGRDFRKAIDECIHKFSVLLAVLGRDWLESRDASGQRRLDDETDFVRLEIASALQRDIPVVPVLVRGARMPRAEQLPADLRELAYRNAVELTHARWKSDVSVLIQALRPYLEAAGDEAPPQVAFSGDRPPAAGLMQNPVGEDQPPAAATGIERAILERVGRELAGYIGPIAEIVVKRAAKRCASVTDLCATVAQEIESGADRAEFLASFRR